MTPDSPAERGLDILARNALFENDTKELGRTVKGDGEAREFVVDLPGRGGGH